MWRYSAAMFNKDQHIETRKSKYDNFRPNNHMMRRAETTATPNRHQRSYSPKALRVLRGPGEKYGERSHWVVCDDAGYAELYLMPDSEAYYENTLYVENLVVKEGFRGRGFGRRLCHKIELFAKNIGVEYIQLDSERESYGFWRKMGYREIDEVYYQNKIAMIKRLKPPL